MLRSYGFTEENVLTTSLCEETRTRYVYGCRLVRNAGAEDMT